MNTARPIAAVLLLTGPVIGLAGLGYLWLWQNGCLYYGLALLPLALCWGAGAWLLRSGPPPALLVEPRARGTERDEEAWAIVGRFAVRFAEGQIPPDGLFRAETYVETLREMSLEMARIYFPSAQAAEDELTLPEMLAAAELAVEELNQGVTDYLPGTHLLTVGQLKWTRRMYGHWQTFAPLVGPIWALWALLRGDPFGAAAQLGVRQLGWQAGYKPLMDAAKTNLSAAGYSLFVQHTGRMLIELFSGRLKGGARRWREHFRPQAATREDTDASSAVPPPALTVAVLGQTKAGKSSLINALLGNHEAAVDILPVTRAVTRHVCRIEGVRNPLVLLDTPGLGDPASPSTAFDDTVQAARESSLALLILDVLNAARQPDCDRLREMREWFDAHREYRRPPILAVVTHVDQLSPKAEWNPPYDGWIAEAPGRPKERAIREAVEHIRAELGGAIVGIVPVCLRNGASWGIEEFLVPAMTGVLPDALNAALVRMALQPHGPTGFIWMLQQVKNSALLLLKAGFLGGAISARNAVYSAPDKNPVHVGQKM